MSEKKWKLCTLTIEYRISRSCGYAVLRDTSDIENPSSGWTRKPA